jgi:UPF0271 protein
MKLDLNCDLGEGEPLSRTRALMRWITSANVACGGHAGDLHSMRACVRLAKQCGVKLGAHPGPWSKGDFGRGPLQITPDEFELLLLQQVGAMERIARDEGTPLHHIKLHGALYHASEADAVLGQRYLDAIRRWWPRCLIYARAGGAVAKRARQGGLRIWEEAFADRAYRADGSLVPRGEPGAILNDAEEVLRRVRLLRSRGEIISDSITLLHLRPQTLCLHSDTPEAVKLARAISRDLRMSGS